MGAFVVKEHASQGTLALMSDMASSAVTGVAGLAKAALVGREDGYRAGTALLYVSQPQPIPASIMVFVCCRMHVRAPGCGRTTEVADETGR